MTELSPATPQLTVADIGEFELIAKIAYGRPQPGSTLLGPGDDAAVFALGGERLVASTDMLVEGRHFRLDWSPPRMIGRKVIAQNAADVAAMGARPVGFLIGLACPKGTAASFVEELYEGLWEGARDLGTALSGGDLVEADHIVVSGTVLGAMDGLTPVTRGGAAPGQVVAVAGELGCSAAGQALIEAGLTVEALEAQLAEPGARAQDIGALIELVERHQSPRPPLMEGSVAARAGATAMIDVSDGLVADLRHVAEASKVGIVVQVDALHSPWQLAIAAERLGASATRWLLSGGEDHALAAVFPSEEAVPQWWTPIGRTVPLEETSGPKGPEWVRLSTGEAAEHTGWRSF
ncbi:thiamine-phosphate kinase [Segniliparus rugosus]|uniref:Thiamine-monophosphate kinase n=1 Tax=Segniliparus rugosus (strain ATCC BAA-974 / DSM 45345 / CCUG 50838 / CIP 108380 / JCM 13579 / CDC 945) TaxID=679197 RepID=E5XMG9_SEGRC|nr:thiamine-phosphate kinase [Segniliparus rugosus]EFV14462.1 thiamine-monophosphate kinase [Segniliparus rugosus ATCC BAA-974]